MLFPLLLLEVFRIRIQGPSVLGSGFRGLKKGSIILNQTKKFYLSKHYRYLFQLTYLMINGIIMK